jgi:hypothetical protein
MKLRASRTHWDLNRPGISGDSLAIDHGEQVDGRDQ